MLRALLALALVGITAAQTGDVFVDISTGTVKGQSFLLPEIIPGEKTINRFHGIPFATPPVGDLRFRPPEAAQPWDDVLTADRLPDACPQAWGGILALTHPHWFRFNEDCLYVNVFAPNDTSGAPYPVMVFFHGGGYTGSANIQYPGHFQAGFDVVVVVPNYRVGALGFMSTGDDVAQGNYGFMDQVLLLQWVQENVAAFGGDPNKVTLFGQSAGASSIGLHMMSPYSQGLFYQAVFESGNELAVWAINGPGQAPENYTRFVAEELGCPTTDSLTMMECLRTVDARDLVNTGFPCTPGYYCQGFAPVIDGDYIPMSPFEAREQGLIANIPILTGICREDGSPYTLILIPEAGDGGFTREEFLNLMETRLVALFAPLFPGREEDVVQAMSYYYSPWPHIYDENFNRGMINNMTTDFGFGLGLDEQVKYHQDVNENIYMYIMGYRTKHPSADRLYPPWMGVPHNGELPYVIGFPFYQESRELKIDAQIWDLIRWDEEDQIWTLYMMEMWTNFAKFGNPTPNPVTAPDFSNTTWPIWNNETQKYLYLDRHMEYREEYRQRNFAFWMEYLGYVTGGIDFGPDIQYGVPSVSNAKQPKHKIELNSKATENMYKRMFAPRISELLGKGIPKPYEPTKVNKPVQPADKKPAPTQPADKKPAPAEQAAKKPFRAQPAARKPAPAQPAARKPAEAQPAPKYRSTRKSD